MTAIHNRPPALTVRAGRRALIRLRERGLQPSDVHVIPGAAGGPKALGISGLDKAIFGEWLPRAPQERALIGASIGSWRFAAVASGEPRAQLARLAELYTAQRFARGVSPAEVSRKSALFLEALLSGREDTLLNHP
ncbi:MAG: patatin-like phospholipase family protein, partial [Marinobacter sp.]|nr:patatin-like phospholipase family protein [Marinobacter sp.]